MMTAADLWDKRWLRFLLVGGMNTAASYGVYAALLFFGLPYQAANLGGLVFGILFSFRTHSGVVFRSAGAVRSTRFLRFLACWAFLYGVNILLIGAFMRHGLSAYWAGALAIVPMALLSYSLQRLFVFGAQP